MEVSSATIYRKTKSGEWRSRSAKRDGRFGQPQKEILVADLPSEIQLRIAQQEAAFDEKPVEDAGTELVPLVDNSSSLNRLNQALKRFSTEERDAWITELTRLAAIIERYASINPKRIKNPSTQEYEFASAVISLCNEATCTEAIILKRESGRAKPPSPLTLDRWLRNYRRDGSLAFIRSLPTEPHKNDRRKALISEAAIEWINANWRNFRNPTDLY